MSWIDTKSVQWSEIFIQTLYNAVRGPRTRLETRWSSQCPYFLPMMYRAKHLDYGRSAHQWYYIYKNGKTKTESDIKNFGTLKILEQIFTYKNLLKFLKSLEMNKCCFKCVYSAFLANDYISSQKATGDKNSNKLPNGFSKIFYSFYKLYAVVINIWLSSILYMSHRLLYIRIYTLNLRSSKVFAINY